LARKCKFILQIFPGLKNECDYYSDFSFIHCTAYCNVMLCGIHYLVHLLKLTAVYDFAVFVDSLIVELRQSGLGLYIGSTYTGALLYANDIALLACSCFSLQKLINICMAFGLQRDIRFNPVKSQTACFGSKSPICDCINIGGKFIKWSDRIKYLGYYFRCGRIEVDSSSYVGKFYGAFNNIPNVLGSRKDQIVSCASCQNILSSILAVQL